MRRNLEGEPSVEDFSYASESKEVTIDGQNFEDRGCVADGAISVTFADQSCTIDSESTS
jgi:hypothetical protein